MGMRMPGWYDITSLSDTNRSEDVEGIERSRKYFHDLISEEIQSGIPADRILLGGFSQGGAMSLHAGLTCPHKLSGIFGLSSYMPLRDKFKAMIEESGDANKKTKIFMGHGDADPVVKYEHGKMTADQLKEWSYDVTFNTYP
jgi:predicted esterase